jgi:hypothetical protein
VIYRLARRWWAYKSKEWSFAAFTDEWTSSLDSELFIANLSKTEPLEMELGDWIEYLASSTFSNVVINFPYSLDDYVLVEFNIPNEGTYISEILGEELFSLIKDTVSASIELRRMKHDSAANRRAYLAISNTCN